MKPVNIQKPRSGLRSAKGLAPALMLAILLLVNPLPAAPADGTEPEGGVFFDEHLGQVLPGDVLLRDEQGQTVRLDQLVDKPTILNFVYFDCPGVCTPLLNEVADILGKTDLDPRKEPFQILTVSFEPRDTPQVAAEKRANYLAQLSRPLPEESWRFMTGDAPDLARLTKAAGFSYKRAGFEYTHPGGLILLAPDRTIVRYLYGTKFLPFDFKMGIAEAAKGHVLPTTARLLTICFSYDPEGRTYVFNTMKVVGSSMLLTVGLFAGFLAITQKRGSSGLGRRARHLKQDNTTSTSTQAREDA